MDTALLIAADVVAILVLTFGLYFPRHRRRDMVVALIGINVGVLGVAVALAESNVTAGLGLGLFGVLSIIRLRSNELDQEEIAYYFVAIAVGLLGGLPLDPTWVSVVLMAVVLLAMFVADHPSLLQRHERQIVTLDRAIADADELERHLAEVLSGEIDRVRVRRLDLVQDTTTVDVRFRR